VEQATFIPDWLFRQDFVVFAAFFGWLLTAVLALARPLASAAEDRLPWAWFGWFALAMAVACALRMLSFVDPLFREFSMGPVFETLGFGLLAEFALRSRPRLAKRALPAYATLFAALLGLAMEAGGGVVYEAIALAAVVFAGGFASATLVRQARAAGRRELGLVAIGVAVAPLAWLCHPQRLGLLGVSVPRDFGGYLNYGSVCLGTGLFAALAVLAGLWAHRLRSRVEAAVPGLRDRLRFWGCRVLPAAAIGILAASYVAVEWIGERARQALEREYLYRSQTAALSMDARQPWGEELEAEASAAEAEEGPGRSLGGQLQAIRRIGTDALNVYLWRPGPRGAEAFRHAFGPARAAFMEAGGMLAAGREGHERVESFLAGPAVVDGELGLAVNSPIIDPATGAAAFWLGIDVAGESWFAGISRARLQAMLVAGLVLALAIFFLYYQIDREAKADLALAKERAEAADRAKSEFLAVISHEIRTPLQSVLGYGDLLRATPLNDRQMACLDTIQSEGKILLRIVQDILDFSNLRKASFELKEGPTRLRQVVEETFRTVEPLAARKGLEARLEMDEGLPEAILADGVRLRQTLLNLFSNSVKYTERGSVLLRVGRAAAPAPAKGADRPLAGLRFVVEDTGVGIAKEDMKRLFEPFIQLELSGSVAREGAGLGLAIVKRIVELMGGSVEVESERGKGSRFTVSLAFPELAPDGEETRSEEATRQLELQERAAMGRRFPLKILVADDNPMVRRLVVQYLESLGYAPEAADGGREAQERGADYDLVVIDLRMPEVDGPTAARRIREEAGEAERPWILGVSATLAETEIERALASGINAFLGKPFFADSLAEQILRIPWLGEREREEAGEGPAPAERAGETALERPFAGAPDAAAPADAGAAEAGLTGGSLGDFAPEMIDAAVAEAFQLGDAMGKALGAGDYLLIREKAHYLSNTAMAIGIDSLFIDSKALQKAAEQENASLVEELLPRLVRNLRAWEAQRSPEAREGR